MQKIVDSFCSYCGTVLLDSFGNEQTYPKRCTACKSQVWDNPKPVVVLLIEDEYGCVLLVRRGIEPGFGLLALPGGHMEKGETWQEAGARESFEEIHVKIDPSKIKLVDVLSSSSYKHVMVFGYVKISNSDVLPFIKNREAQERVETLTPIELAFPTHTNILSDFFHHRNIYNNLI